MVALVVQPAVLETGGRVLQGLQPRTRGLVEGGRLAAELRKCGRDLLRLLAHRVHVSVTLVGQPAVVPEYALGRVPHLDEHAEQPLPHRHVDHVALQEARVLLHLAVGAEDADVEANDALEVDRRGVAFRRVFQPPQILDVRLRHVREPELHGLLIRDDPLERVGQPRQIRFDRLKSVLQLLVVEVVSRDPRYLDWRRRPEADVLLHAEVAEPALQLLLRGLADSVELRAHLVQLPPQLVVEVHDALARLLAGDELVHALHTNVAELVEAQLVLELRVEQNLEVDRVISDRQVISRELVQLPDDLAVLLVVLLRLVRARRRPLVQVLYGRDEVALRLFQPLEDGRRVSD